MAFKLHRRRWLLASRSKLQQVDGILHTKKPRSKDGGFFASDLRSDGVPSLTVV